MCICKARFQRARTGVNVVVIIICDGKAKFNIGKLKNTINHESVITKSNGIIGFFASSHITIQISIRDHIAVHRVTTIP